MTAPTIRPWLSVLAVALAAGPARPDDPPPDVPVVRPVARTVTDYEQFTGRTEASRVVNLKARVTGYLTRVAVDDGADVKEGDLVFEIDSRPYQAEADRAAAALARAEARVRRTEADLRRVTDLARTGAAGRDEADRAAADRDEARADVEVGKAAVATSRLNLGYTRVAAPFAGRVGRRRVDPGNLVKADDTTVVDLVARDPVYVTFDLDERTALRLRRADRDGKPGDGKVKVEIGLIDDEGYPRTAVVDFVDTRVDPATGTLWVRAVADNKDGVLVPGLFARVRVAVGRPYDALLVPEGAVVEDLGRPCVMVVDADGVVRRRAVRVGPRTDGLRVVSAGLAAEDRVVADRPDRLRPGAVVRPREVRPGDKPAREKGPAPGEGRP